MPLLLRDLTLLALRLDRILPGTIDGPVADAALHRHVVDEPRPDPRTLLSQADRLVASLRDSGLGPRRERFVGSQIQALRCRIRIAAGEPVPYVDEVRLGYGVTPRRGEPDVYREAHRELGELLPGRGTLRRRMAAHREWDRIPPERLRDAVVAMTSALAARTRAAVPLPGSEQVEHDIVPDRPWTAFTQHLGGHRSRITVSAAARLRREQLLPLLAHEAYPGHHTQYCRAVLAGSRFPELGLRLVHSPQGLLAEGLADAALDVLPGPGWGALAQQVLRGCGLPMNGVAAEAMESALVPLGRVRQDAALMRHADGAGPDEVVAHLSRWLVVDEDRARRMLAFLEHPQWRSYPTAYAEGRPLVAAWLARPGTEPLDNLRVLLDEPRTPADLQRDLGPAGSAAPDRDAVAG